MLTRLFLVASLGCLCFFMYGILYLIVNVEENACRMTYMYEYPQFVRIHFEENELYPKYGLYAYSEGHLTESARVKYFTGAPVIFLPGNSGSYKQARSLGSVGLRKGLDYNWKQHLDYFTVDFNEEYSAFFGGYLETQKSFVKYCIKEVLALYKNLPNPPTEVILIGHSMGGKVAQSLLADPESSKYINTVLTISTPIDRPVLNFDQYFEIFYRKAEKHLLENMKTHKVTNETNFCGKYVSPPILSKKDDVKYNLDEKLLITIGGGSRDLQVHSGLTASKYSDVHALTTSIPFVWLTTDHLCAVWCRELMIVINRFLYDIIAIDKSKSPYKNGQGFVKEKDIKLSKAFNYFVRPKANNYRREINMFNHINHMGEWKESSLRVFTVDLKNGLTYNLIQMIRLIDLPQHQILNVEAINIESNDWVFGCNAAEVSSNMRYCTKATSLTHLAEHLPSAKHERYFLSLDLHKIKRANPTWSHILLRVAPSKKPMRLNIDIHGSNDRTIHAKRPKLIGITDLNLLKDTALGSSFYRILVHDLEESHQAVHIKVKPTTCPADDDHAVAEICVPWSRGSVRYKYITQKKSDPISIYSPISRPLKYNATLNPIVVKLHLNPNCRYSISMYYSFGETMSRIVQQYSQWLPAHLAAILFLALKYQISISPSLETFKCGKLHSALLNCSPFFIITATKIFAKLLQNAPYIPAPDDFNQSLLISVIIHGSAFALLILATAGTWIAISCFGNVAHKILFKMIQMPIPTISSALIPVIQKLPVTIVVVLIAIAFASCGGVSMICGTLVYFILMTKIYEDYLEEFVYKTAKEIANKLFGRNTDDETETSTSELINSREEETTETDATATPKEDESESKTKEPTSDTEKKDVAKDIAKDLADLNGEESIDAALAKLDELNDEELNKLLEETIKKQKEIDAEKKKNEDATRKEYDSVHEALSSLNFHMTLFMLFFLAACLQLPATVSWAKNYNFSPTLTPDPLLLPTVITLVSAGIIWQLPTPRNLYAYHTISATLYVVSAISVVYCQDSVHRLNSVISTAFAFIAGHQLIAPKKPEPTEKDDDGDLKEHIEKMKEFLSQANDQE